VATFVLTCIDKPDSLALRLASRDAHLDYVRRHPGFVRLAGPFLDSAGGMVGSLFIVEAEDIGAAEAFTASDPYALAGLFERVEIRAWRATVGALP